MPEDISETIAKQGRQAFNGIISQVDQQTNAPREQLMSRVRPLYKQIVYATSRFPEVRDKYPAFIVGTAATVTSIPVLLRRGRIAGVTTGLFAATLAAGGMKLTEIVEARNSRR